MIGIVATLCNVSIYVELVYLQCVPHAIIVMPWNETELDNTTKPKYLVVTLVRSLSYKQHIHNMKVATRNNLMTKLAMSRWCANPSTIRTTALSLGYSMARYAAPVWERSPHARNLDPELNQACRSVTKMKGVTWKNLMRILVNSKW